MIVFLSFLAGFFVAAALAYSRLRELVKARDALIVAVDAATKALSSPPFVR